MCLCTAGVIRTSLGELVEMWCETCEECRAVARAAYAEAEAELRSQLEMNFVPEPSAPPPADTLPELSERPL